MNNSEVPELVEVLQQQITLLKTMQEQIDTLQSNLLGTNTANQIILELLIAASPAQKQTLTEGLTQLLGRPELLPNNHALELLKQAHQAAASPSRTTPEGRRSALHLVSEPVNDQPQG